MVYDDLFCVGRAEVRVGGVIRVGGDGCVVEGSRLVPVVRLMI